MDIEIKIYLYAHKAKIDYPKNLKETLVRFHTIYDPTSFFRKKINKTPSNCICFFDREFSTIPLGYVDQFMAKTEKKFKDQGDSCTFLVLDCRKGNYLKPRELITPDLLDGFKLRESQLKALHSLYTSNIKYRGIIAAFTGAGKTLIILGICKLLDINPNEILIVTPTITLSSELKEKANKCNIEVTVLKSGTKFEYPTTISTANIDYFTSKLKKQSLEFSQYINSLKAIIVDEAHGGGSDSYSTLFKNAKNAIIRYGLSATPFKNEEFSDSKVLAELGQVVIKITARDVIMEKAVSTPEFYFHTLPINLKLGDIFTKEKKEGTLNYSKVYDVAIINNLPRNEYIRNVCYKLVQSGLKVLIFVINIEHGNIIKGLLDEYKISNLYIHGKLDPTARSIFKQSFESGNTKVLVLSKVFDAGVDIAGGTDAIILAGAGKSKVGVIQRTGRGTRLQEDNYNKVLVIDFNDPYIYVSKHTRERKLLLKYYEFDIVEDEKFIDTFISSKVEWRKNKKI